MAKGRFSREVREQLQEVANRSALAREVLLGREIFEFAFEDEDLLRLVADVFEGIHEALTALAIEIDSLGDRLADLDDGV